MASVRVPITNLFSGVARQPAGKRLTSELQEVDNAILTLERSAEKRPPTEFIHGGAADGSLDILGDSTENDPDDIAYFFFDKTDTERYLIVVNRAAAHGDDELIKIIKLKDAITSDLTGIDITNPRTSVGDCIIESVADITKEQTISFSAVNSTTSTGAEDYKNYRSHDYYTPVSGGDRVDDLWEYVAYNPNNKPAREILKATFFGSSLLILNSEVPATSWTTAVTAAGLKDTHPRSRKLNYRVSAVPAALGKSLMGDTYDTATKAWTPENGCHSTHPISLFKGADGSGQIILGTMYVNNLSNSNGVGTIDMSGLTITDLKTLCTELNGMTIPTASGGDKAMSTFGTFGVNSSFSTGNVSTEGKLYFNTANGSDIVQFYDDQGGTTALTLGISGSTGTFDATRVAGANLQPIIASSDDATGTGVSSAESWGGASDTADMKLSVTEDGTTVTGQVASWTATDTFDTIKGYFETALSGYTITLNSAKTGFYIVNSTTNNIPDVVTGQDANGITFCEKYGLAYSSSEHKLVRDDIVTTGDVIETEVGQNISSFRQIELPPVGDDVNRINGEEDAIAALYSDGNENGYGKVWYCREGYLTFPSGFYRTVSNTVIPHYNQVRCEEEHSVWYEPSFPFLISNVDDGEWEVKYPDWTPRETGTETNNPGPQAFQDGKKGVISDVCFWRERLFFAVEDMVFSSRNNDWYNLWLDDPDSITSDDPIDIRASSGKYTRISFMIPFNDFLFINTGGETQYELQGSNNVISPTTAELAPTSFYSSSQIVEPLVLGTQIYWFDKERLYLYNSSAGASVNNATEVSIHAHGYLPNKVRHACVAAAQDSIFAIDDSSPNNIYVYTARWAGGDIVQNAFYKYILPQTVVTGDLSPAGWAYDSEAGTTTLDAPEVEYLWYVGNYLYLVVLRPAADGKMNRFIERTKLEFADINTPRIDRGCEIPNTNTTDNDTSDTIYYDGSSATTIKLPYWDPSIDKVVPGSSWVTQAGTALTATNDSATTGNTVLTVNGNWDHESDGTPLYMRVGSNYTMKLELSRVVYRDGQSGLPIEGTLNLKMMNIQHFKSGVYDVEITRNKRKNSVTGSTPTITTTHSPLSINNDSDALGALLVEGEGEYTTKVMGFSDTTTIAITSDYTTPVAISSLDFTGMFKPTNSSIAP